MNKKEKEQLEEIFRGFVDTMSSWDYLSPEEIKKYLSDDLDLFYEFIKRGKA